MSEVKVAKTGECLSLTKKSILTYQVGYDVQGDIFLCIKNNSGAATISKEWISWKDIKYLLVSTNFKTEDIRKSYKSSLKDTPGFMMAVLLHEKLVEKVSAYYYIGLDDKSFISSIRKRIQEKMDNDKIDPSTLLGHPKKK